ncbi:hypothetical protein QNH14_16110 [Apirhabdus apintestini]|nr:hypothetical protein QNH14_16110 [Enterobacteriaceae bacterium CA-0114]
MGALNEQYTLFVIYNDALKSGNSVTLSNTAQKLSAESQTWPDPLSNLISPLLDGSYRRANHEAIAQDNEGIEEHLGRICRRTLAGRYPFADSEEEVKLADFERFFAAGGLVDDYYQKIWLTKWIPQRTPGDIKATPGKAITVSWRCLSARRISAMRFSRAKAGAAWL